MTNSRFASIPRTSLKIKAAFVKYLTLLVFFVGALFTQVNATITVNSTPQTNNDFCGTGSPSLILPIVATSNCGTGSITYQWYVGSTFATSSAITASGTPNYSGWNTSTLNVNNAAALGTNTTYWAIATESSGACSDADTLGPFNYVQVSSVPTVTVTPSSPYNVCEGDEAQFAATVTAPSPAGVLTYTWSKTPDGGAAATVQTTSDVLVLVDTFTYTPILTDDQDDIDLSVSNACGSGSATTVTVNVNPRPDVTVASSQSTLSACEGNGFNVSYNISNADYDPSRGGSVAWTIVASGDASLIALLTLSGSGNTAVSLTGIGGALAPGAYSATFNTITNTTDGCAKAISTNSINVNIYPEPIITFSATPSNICNGTGSGTSFSITVSNAEYTVGGTPVSVNWSAAITEASFASVTGCAGGSAGLLSTTLTGNGNGTTTYTIPTSMGVGIYQYTITGITNTSNSCTGTLGATASVDWRVDPTPDIAVIPTSANVCEGATNSSFVISVTNTTYCGTTAGSGTSGNVSWSLPYTTGANQVTNLTSNLPASPITDANIGAGTFSTNASLAVGTYVFDPTTITVTAPAAPGCNRDVSLKTFTLTVNPEPTVTFDKASITMCEGNTDSFNVVVANSVLNTVDQNWSIYYSQTGASAVTGTPCAAGTFAGILPASFTGAGDGSQKFYVPSTLSPGFYTYTLTGIANTSAGCTGSVGATATITIIVEPRPIITMNPDTKDMCELDAESFNLSITNSTGCSGIGTTSTASWALTVHTDNVNSNVSSAIPGLTGSGDNTYTIGINSPNTLTPIDHIFDASVAASAGACSGATTRDTFTVSVDPRPEVKINNTSGDQTMDVCQGTAGSFTFEVSNALHNAVGVDWEITYTEASGTVATSCVGGVTADMPGGSGSYTGTGNGTFTVTVPSTLAVGQYTYTVTNIVNTDGPCTGTVDGVTFGPQTITINVYPTPSFTVQPDSSEVCEYNVATSDFYLVVTNAEYCSTPTTLTSAGWSISGITDNIISNAPATITGSGNGATSIYNSNTTTALTAGSYSWTATSITTTGLSTNCSNTISSDNVHILTVNPAPDVVINGVTGPHTIDICQGELDSFSFDVSNAVLNGQNVNWEITYTESSGQVASSCTGGVTADLPGGSGSYTGIGNTDTTIYIPTTLPVGQYIYTVTNIENTDEGCTGHVDGSSPNTQVITINVYPKPEFVVTPDSSEVCENNIAISDFSINVTNAEYCSTPTTLTSAGWSISGVTDNIVSNAPGTITGTGNGTTGSYNANTSATLTQGSYSWDATTISTTGLPVTCTNTSSDSIHILTVNPAPDASFVSSTLTVCEGDTDSLEITVTNAVLNGNNVNWSYDVSESSGNMNSACIVTATENASLARDSSGSGNTTYKYFIPGNLVPGVYTYTISNVLNTDESCTGTSATSTITVYIYPKIEIDLTPTATEICEGETTDFDIEVTNARYCSALNTASNNASWTLVYTDATASNITGPPLTGSGNSSYTFTANNAGLLSAGVYQFITSTVTASITSPTAASCPVNVADTFTLTVNPEPVVTFSAATVNVCEGSTGTFNVVVSNAQYTTGSGTVEANWSVDLIGDSTDVANSCASGGAGAGIFGLTGTNNLNGTGDSTITVSVPATLAPGVYTYTLNGVVNSSNTCTGSIGAVPTVTIIVYPQPDVDLTTDSLTICENTQATFDLSITNAQYCATIGGSLINVNWEVTHTDGVQSNVPASVWAGSGNMAATTYTVNTVYALTNGGSPYTFDISQIENTTHSCVNTDSFTGTELTVIVNDLPVLTINSFSSSVCDGDAATVTYSVSDVGAAEGWTFTFSTDGGTTNHTVTGVGPVTIVDTTTLALTPPGVYTVSYSAITNTTTTCVGNTPSNNNITVLDLPDVTSFVNAAGTDICSGLTNDYNVTVANAAGKGWEIFYTIDGVAAPATWTGTGNGTFTRTVPTQYHQDPNGAFDARPLVIDSIRWTSGAGTPPLCINSASITDPNATLNIKPRPYIGLVAPSNVCINYTADIEYFVGGVRSTDIWDFDWYTTGPTDGPNNITGSDTSTGTFTTQPLTPVGTSNVNVPTVTNTSTGCDSSYSSSPWSEDITVDPPTVPGTLSPSYTICDGDVGPYVFTLTGYTGDVQNWDSSDNDGFTWYDIGNTTDTHTVASPHLTTRYHVVVKSGACPADTSNEVILFVHPQPAASIVSVNDSICEGSDIDVVLNVSGVPNTHGYSVAYTVTNGTSTSTGTWTGTGSSATISETLTNGGSGYTAGTWSVILNSITNTNTGCDTTLTDMANVLVKANPIAGTASAPNDTLCANSGGIVVWDGTVSDGYVVAWQKKTPTGSWSTITGSAGDTLEFTSLATTTLYRAVIENAPCTGQVFSAAVTITVLTNNPLAEWDLPASIKYCASATDTVDLTYDVTGTNGYDWTLILLEGDVTHTITGTGDVNDKVFTTTAGRMTETFNVTLVKITISSGTFSCTKNLDNTGITNVTIIDMPTVTLNSVTSTVCDGDRVTASITVSDIKTSESWKLNYTINSVSQDTTGTGPGTFSFEIPYTVSGGNATQTVALTSIENTIATTSASTTCTNTLSGVTATYEVRGPTVAGTIGSSDSVCYDASGSISQTAASTNGGVITDWLYSTDGGANWASTGNTSTTQVYSNITTTTHYRAVYTNSPCDTASSNTVVITVLTLPNAAIGMTAGNDTICEGATTTVDFTVTNVENGQAFTLYWTEGATNKSMSFTNNASNAHSFTTGAISSNTDITLTQISTTSRTACTNTNLSSTVTITVQDNPAATIASYDATLCHGSTVDFTVTVSNVATTDAWTLVYTLDATTETVTGTGAGTFSFTTSTTVTSTSDVLALVSITNNSSPDNCSSSLTDSKTISVDPTTVAGVIIEATDTICKGGSTTISQTTAGTGVIVGWEYMAASASSWTGITNTSTTLNVINLQETTSYRAVYQSGLCATANSNVVTITVLELPGATVSVSAGNDTICAGATTTIDVTVTNVENGQTFTLYWVEGTTSKSMSFTNNASNSHTFTTGAISSTTDITLSRIATTSRTMCDNSSLSSTVTINVQDNPLATIASNDSRLCHGSTVDFAVTVSSVATTDAWTLVYTLDGNTETVTGTGAGTFSFTTTNTVTSTSDVLALVSITNNSSPDNCSSSLTDSETISVDPTTVAGVITEATDTICKGGSTTISQTTAGTGVIVGWEYMAASASSWTGITNTSTTLNVINLQETTSYRAVYQSGLCATANSNVVTINVLELPVGTLSISAGNDTICAGTTTTIDLTVTNIEDGQTFTIYYVEGSSSKSMSFTNNSSNSHTFTTGSLATTTDITLTRIETTSRTMCTNSSLNTTVTVTVQENPLASIASYDARLCHGSTVDFSVTVSNVATSDNWTLVYTLDGTTETVTGTGAGTYSFTTTNTVTSTSDVLALVSITNNSSSDNCNSSLTESVTISVDPTTVAGVITEATDTICKGGSTTISQTTSGTGVIVGWEYMAASASSWTGITNTSTTLNVINLQETTSYRAVYQSGLCATANSNVVTINVLELPVGVLSITAGNDTICAGTTTTIDLTVTNIEDGQTFTIYYLEGTTSKSMSFTNNSSNSHTFTTGTISSTTDITLTRIETTSRTMCTNSSLNSTVTVNVQDNPLATIASYDARLCHGETVDFTVTVSSVATTDAWTLVYTLDGTTETVTGTGAGTFSFTTTKTVTSTSDVLALVSITNNTSPDACNSTLTESVTIAVDPTTVAGVIGTYAISRDTIVCKGGSGYVKEFTTGTGSIVKWQRRKNGTTTWVDINSTNNTQFFFNLLDTTEFRAVYQSGVCATDASAPVTATPKNLPFAEITTIVDDSICAGTTGDFEITVDYVDVGADFTVYFSEGTVGNSESFTQNASGVHTITSGVLTSSTLIQLTAIVVTNSGNASIPACTNTLTSNGTITVVDLPFASITAGPDTLCQQDKIVFTVTVTNVLSTDNWKLRYELENDEDTITGTGPGSVTWVDADSNTAESAKIQLIEILNVSNLGICKSVNTDDWDIYIYKPTEPGEIVASTDTICKGGSTSIAEVIGTPKQGVTVSWEYRPISTSNWTGLTNNNTTLTIINLLETTDYRAIYKSGVCDTAHSNVVRIQVEELPLATISGSTTICAGDSVDLTVTVSNVGSIQDWEIDYLAGTLSGLMTGTGSGTHTLRVGNFITNSDVILQEIRTVSGTPQCVNDKLTNNAQARVNINQRPFASLNSTVSPICQNNTSSFSFTVSNVKSGDNWTLTYQVDDAHSTSVTTTGKGPGTYTVATPSLTDDKTYVVRFTNILNTTTGCDSSLSSTMDIVVDATTTPGSVASDTTVCYGAHVGTITHTGGNGSIIRWETSIDNGTSWSTISNTNSTYTYTNLTTTTLYRVVKMNGVCVEAATSPVTITVNELPVASISGSDTVCAGESGNLTVTVINAQGEDWRVSYLVGTVIDTISVSGPLTTGTINTGSIKTNTDVTLKKVWMTSGTPQCVNNNLSNNAKATVEVDDEPNATLISLTDSVCTGSPAYGKVNVSDVRTSENWIVYWSINGGTADSVTGTGPGSFNFTTANLTVDPSTLRLTRIVNTTTGCEGSPTDQDVVTVSPTTVGGTLTANDTVCKGANSGTLTLGADAIGTVMEWEYSTNGGTTWTSINNTNSTYSYSNLTVTTQYRVTVKSGACNTEYSSVVTITVNELPVAAIVSVGANSICEGSSTYVALNVTNVGAGMAWELTYLQGSSVKTLTGSGPGADTIWTGTLSSTTDITLQTITITSGSPQCTNGTLTNQYTTTITVIENPFASIKSYPTDICKGETPTVTVDVDDVLSTEAWTLLYRVNNGSTITSTGVGSGTFTLANMPQFNTEGPNGLRLVSITNTSTNPNCTSALSDSITINVDSTSVGGSISGVSIVCKGDNGTLALGGYRGSIVKWQYSTDGINYYDIANTSDTLGFSNLQTKTWYRVQVMNGVCTPEFSTAKTVDVQELPTVTINNPTIDICENGSTTLSLTIGNVTSTSTWSIDYEENGTSGTYTSGTGTTESITFGPYTTNTTIEILSITVTNGLGCSNTISEKAVVTVTPNPTASITTVPDSLCQGDILVFSANIDNVATGTKWELDYEVDGTSGPTKRGTGSGTFTINTGRSVSPSLVKVQLTEIVLDNTLGCNTTLNDSAEIKVSPTTVGGTLAPATSTICEGGSVTLTLSGETGAVQNWEYSTDNGATWAVLSNTANSVTITNINVTTLYRAFVKSGTCSGAYSTVSTVTVIETPNATVTSNATVCPGDVATFTLSVTGVPATDGWSVIYKRNGTTVGTAITGTGSGDFNFNVTGSTYNGNPTLITVELESIENTTYGCINNDLNSSATARVTPNPVAGFTAVNNCEDSTISFNNTSSIPERNIATYKWYFGDGDSSRNASPTHAYAAAGTYNVTLVVWSDNGCRGEVTQTIEVYPNPTADFTFSNVCKNETFSATDRSSVSSGSITGWFWQFGDGTTSTDQNPTHAYAASGNYDVTLTVTTNNGCSNTVSKELTVYILPEANFVASPVCEDAPMQFVNASAIGYGTMTYEWNFAGQGASTAKDPVFTFTGFGTFSIELIATSNNGCKDTIVRDVTVYPAPTADFTVADVCIGDASVFTNTSTVPGTDNIIKHAWDFGDNLSSSTLVNPTFTYAAAGDYNVTLTVTSNRGCENSVTKVASVIALPDVMLTANGPTEFCDGDSVVLSANGNARTYDWSWDGGSSTNSTVTALTHGWYKVRITAPPIGCANEDSIFITVHQLPDAKAWPRNKVTQSIDTISRGQSIDLHASGGVTYLWSPTTYLNPSDMADVMAERVDMTTDYTVTVTDEFGCTNEAQLRIFVLDNFDLTVYNAVTPNGDGMNDTWIIENIWAYPEAEVVIFNRYGMEVYRTTGYTNNWDAKYKGNDLPDGPYYYVIVHPDFDIVYKGVINVIRETTGQ